MKRYNSISLRGLFLFFRLPAGSVVQNLDASSSHKIALNLDLQECFVSR